MKEVAKLETYLATRTFLVTERITLADITVAQVLKSAFENFIDSSLVGKFPNCVRFAETVVNQDAIKPFLAPINYIEKALAYTPPAKDKKAEKPAAAPAAPKEKPAKKPAADEEDDEPLVPAEPKLKNPLDDLPKSNFNLEDWKRAYSNMDTRGAGGSLEWFYSKCVHT